MPLTHGAVMTKPLLVRHSDRPEDSTDHEQQKCHQDAITRHFLFPFSNSQALYSSKLFALPWIVDWCQSLSWTGLQSPAPLLHCPSLPPPVTLTTQSSDSNNLWSDSTASIRHREILFWYIFYLKASKYKSNTFRCVLNINNQFTDRYMEFAIY